MRAVPIIVGYALRESMRRRVFVVVLVLTAVFLVLYALALDEAFESVETLEAGEPVLDVVDERTIAGATLLGLGMFATLFLGTVLAIFLTLGVVRGDAERGLLQPLVARPVGRAALLAGRFVAAAGVCGAYTAAVFTAAVVLVHGAGGWWPDSFIVPALELVGAVVVIAALSLLGSTFLSSTANGIAIFMVFGAGLVAGLLGQIGEVLDSGTLIDVARIAMWALPFEALYQDALDAMSGESLGLTGEVLRLGPFGGAQALGAALAPWTLAYLAATLAAAQGAFARRDL